MKNHHLHVLKRLATLGLVGGMVLAAGCGDEGATPTEAVTGNNAANNNGNNANNNASTNGGNNAQENPELGDSEFVSADAQSGQETEDNAGRGDQNAPSADADGGAGEEERTVEEGDIYRTLSSGMILNLNAYRGLQLIDISDVENPRVVGRVRVTGSPVELYVVEDKAFVLLNNWQGYYGSRDDLDVDSYQGGLVLAVDISDPTQPRVTGQAQVPGWIQTSRLTRGNGKEALFVAANDWTSGQNQTVVRSFAVSGEGAITERTTLDLGGYVTDIQATPQHLMVARYDWNREGGLSTVSVIDISDEDGFMIEGATIETEGFVQKKTNMDIYNGILRVASAGRWQGGNTNHLETFDIADIQRPRRVDHKTFGHNEDLYGTLFLGNKAFFVTYFRQDPFHAFEITDEGVATERAEYIISGWNDWFRPVFGGTRLVGIGVDDQQGWSMAVSLYDIEELSNPDPFISRSSIGDSWSWSEARWDDRAFSVLENAVDVAAEDGTRETGLVLLPFTGWSEEEQRYVAAVQIFTFSEATLTPRGVMDHGTQVRRSFRPSDDVTANLSEAELSLFDAQNPDEPQELGRVELAPNYADFFVFGQYGARVKYNNDYYYGWYGNDAANLPPNVVDIVPVSADPDSATPVATVEIPSNAQVFKAGDQLVSVVTTWTYPDNQQAIPSSEVQVFDLSDPRNPREAGSLTTDRIGHGYGYWGWGWEDCWDCGGWWWGYSTAEAYEAGDALVFPQRIYENEIIGREHACSTWVNEPYTETEYYSGGITCRSLDGGPEECDGQIYHCTLGEAEGEDGEERGQWECVVVEASTVNTQTSCWDYDRYRYWTRFKLEVLNLTNPDAPTLSRTIEMPEGEEDVNLLAEGERVHISYKEPVVVDGDSRGYVRYFFKTLDLSNPASPRMSAGVNVPGELIAVEGDTVFTRDYLWGERVVDTSVNKLEVREGRAYLRGTHRFEDHEVHNVVLDGAGHLLVSHRLAWLIASQDPSFDWSTQRQELTILSSSGALNRLGHVEVDQWAQLQDAEEGRALFQVPGGLLVINFENATRPNAQAYFPLQGWPRRILLEDGNVFFPAGRYGMYKFEIDTHNLLLH